MTYKIEVDVLEAVNDFYPGLSLDDAKQIAESIVDKWDYTQMYDGINDDISWYADSHDIDLDGKDDTLRMNPIDSIEMLVQSQDRN